jgi:hypothetical protein
VYISRRKREDLANCYSSRNELLTVLGNVALRLTRSGQVIERNHRRFAKDAFRAEWVFLRHVKD